jgi:hypothetical protein
MDNEETINQPVTEEINIIKDNAEVIAEVPEIKVPQIIGEGQPIQKTGEVENNPINTNPNNTGQTGPKGIDWAEAKEYYLDSFTRTYADIAKKYGLSPKTVEQRGNEEKWVECRKKLGERALLEFEENKIMEIAAANNHHLNIFRNLQVKASRKLLNPADLKTGELKQLADVYKIAVEGERLILGLPTSNTKSEIMGKLTTDLNLAPEKIAEMDAFFKNESV